MLLASPIKEIKAFGVFGFPNLDGTPDLEIWLEMWNGQRFCTLFSTGITNEWTADSIIVFCSSNTDNT